MKKTFSFVVFVALFLCNAFVVSSKSEHLLPKPQSITLNTTGVAFNLNRDVAIESNTDNYLLNKFLEETGCTVVDGASAVIKVNIVSSINGAHNHNLAEFPDEAYTLDINGDVVEITAITHTGVTRAAQTLIQLAEGYETTPQLEALTITDYPAFKLRGYMHDIGRSYISVEELKKEIELLARFKVNVFHWHLTENQGWRFETKLYPKLNTDSYSRYDGLYYTHEEAKEIQQLCIDNGMILIPEIDMPGHSQGFRKALGYDMQTDQGVETMKALLTEAVGVFDKCPYIHIGGDEVTITYNSGGKNFLTIMIDHVHSLGKKVITWNQPASGFTLNKESGVDLTHMWATRGTAVDGLPNIDSRYNYVNHFDVFADVVGIYKSNIYYEQKGTDKVAGFITALWNDRKTATQEDIVKQNNLYANALASVERAWCGGGKQYIEKGGTTLPNSGDEYEEFADWERRFLFHKNNSLKNEPIPYVKQTNVRWCITDAFPNYGDANKEFGPETEGLKESYVFEGKTYNTGMATGAGVYLRHTWGGTIPTYFSNPQSNTTAYAWTYVYSPIEQTVGALVEFQNYGRSEQDAAPNKGDWDRKGSRIWVNDEELLPPVWTNTGKSINNEVDLGNENFTARKPEVVELKEGWNKVFMKLPYNPNGLRLPKWMFTFVLTDIDGKDAVEGLIYSPNKCMDVAAEMVAASILEAKRYRNSVISESAPGYYPTALAVELNEKIEEIEKTLESADYDEAARNQQLAEIEEVLNSFKALLTAEAMNQPQTNTWYSLCTPNRASRYTTSKGVSEAIIGEAAMSVSAAWKFVERTDGKYNIVDYTGKAYVSPNSSNNTALKVLEQEPNSGWELKPADQLGTVIIVNGTVQFNQTNSGLGFKIYNWGNGSNTADAGCQFVVAEITDSTFIPTTVGINNVDFDEDIFSIVDGSLIINGNYNASLYDITGCKVNSFKPQSGIYILSVRNKNYKVLLK
ncbi:hypothetical protein M2138_000738 [Dysgonomonadaceae bacterium PH5-43]|nr:hypothetical protein [Dysgonomonadaceae bacterium PH5-43]